MFVFMYATTMLLLYYLAPNFHNKKIKNHPGIMEEKEE